MTDTSPIRVGYFLANRFPMLALACAVDPLASANWLSSRELYDVRVYTETGAVAPSFNQFGVVPIRPLAEADDVDIAFVCAGLDVSRESSPEVLALLRRLAGRGRALGGLSFGPYMLAKAGLLDGRRCAVHWELHRVMTEEFPQVEVRDSILEIDGDRYTCAGGTAALDLSLALITEQHGAGLAARIAHQYMHERVRDEHESIANAETLHLAHASQKLQSAVALMSEFVEAPLSLEQVAGRIGISSRQLSRLFRTRIGATFGRYYLRLRLDQARYLVLNTSMTMQNIALATGFVSQSHFTRCYRERFGQTPRAHRRSP